jgi:hypothetical protein
MPPASAMPHTPGKPKKEEEEPFDWHLGNVMTRAYTQNHHA